MKKNNKKNDALFNLIFILFILAMVEIVYFFMKYGLPDFSKKEQEQEQIKYTIPRIKKQQDEQIPQKPAQYNFPKFQYTQIATIPFKDYKYAYTYTFNVNGHIKNLVFETPIPNNENERQYIYDFKITPKPTSIIKKDNNLIAKYNIPELNTQQFTISIEGKAKLRTYYIDTAKKLNKNISPETDLTKYLKPENGIESNDPYIKNIADKIQGRTKEEIIENIYRYIQNHMKYKIIQYNAGAKKALQMGYGKCSEYASIMVALLRAKNIPARIAMGNFARDYDTLHSWVEVYFDEYGWVTYDPTIQPTRVSIYGPNGRLNKVEKRYDVSHKDVYYIKSGINLLSPYVFTYNISSQRGGKASIEQNINIKKLN